MITLPPLALLPLGSGCLLPPTSCSLPSTSSGVPGPQFEHRKHVQILTFSWSAAFSELEASRGLVRGSSGGSATVLTNLGLSGSVDNRMVSCCITTGACLQRAALEMYVELKEADIRRSFCKSMLLKNGLPLLVFFILEQYPLWSRSFRVRKTWVCIQILPLAGSVISGKWLYCK